MVLDGWIVFGTCQNDYADWHLRQLLAVLLTHSDLQWALLPEDVRVLRAEILDGFRGFDVKSVQ